MLLSLKEKAINGMIWSFVERFGYLMCQFITNIVLARLLTPTDFGLVGMILVFIALSLTFIDGGFGSALIQKSNPSELDYSTAFIVNVVLSLLIYVFLVFFSPNIAAFYNQPQLSLFLRIIGVILIIDAFGIVQINILVKRVNFKMIAKLNVISAFVSCCMAIIFAYLGFGVWSLIIQYILNSITRTSLVWFSTSWSPRLVFSMSSFKELFDFGSKILAARFISELYINLQSLVIGKVYTSADLGFFTQAKQLQQIPVNSLATIVNNVTFPVYSELQNDYFKLVIGIRKTLRTVAFFNFPLMVLLTVIANPLISFLYSEKWIDAVPYFQVLCLGFGLLLIVHSVNINVMKALGLSSWVLKLEILKKCIGVILIVIGVKFYGIIGMLLALTLNSYIEFFLNGHYIGKAINYGASLQLKDLFSTFILSLTVGICCILIGKLICFSLPLIEILTMSGIYISLYVLAAHFLHFEPLRDMVVILKTKLK